MRVTLVQAPFKNYAVVNPPLGLAYLAAALKEPPHSAEVTVIDANAQNLSLSEAAQKIIESEPDWIGFTMTSPLVNNSLELVRRIKSKKDIPVVAGGAHPTIMAQDLLLNSPLDIAVRGEGEETVADLMRYFSGALSLRDITGISFKKEGRLMHNPNRGQIANLDALKFPAWELFPLSKYSSLAGKRKFCLPLMTSRGCPYDCIFCYKGTFGKGYRFRSPLSVIEELKFLVNNFHIEEFVVLDDNFTLSKKRAIEISERIIESRLNISWRLPNGITVKSASPALFRKLKEAGCYQIAVGVESGSQEILDRIGKGITINQIRNAFTLAREAKLETTAFFMIGNIGEDEETIDETIDFAISLKPDFAQFTIATPYPGTRMREIVLQEGRLLSDDWQDYASYGGKAVFEHGKLSAWLMRRKYREAYLRYYLRPAYILKRLRGIFSLSGLMNIFTGIKVLFRMVYGKD